MTSSPNRPGVSALVLGGLGLAYPFAVFLMLDRVPPGAVVVAALALVAGRLVALRRGKTARALLPALAAVFVATAVAGAIDSRLAALVYPVLMSLGMAAAFGLSLARPPSLVECFAALTEPQPSPAAQAYMRRVSLVWCMFLLGNAGVSAATAWWGDLGLWALYNGLISYLLMACLFAVEYAVRRQARAREALP
jgi:uncharacterized membrane protein